MGSATVPVTSSSSSVSSKALADTQAQARGANLLSSLPALQNVIKRDPQSYTDEFLIQFGQYNALRAIIEQGISTSSGPTSSTNNKGNGSTGKAGQDEERFRELVGFVAQTASSYPKHTKDLPNQIQNLLLRSHANLSADTRRTLVHSLVLLRNRNVITGPELLKTLFPLLSMTTSASIRSYILKTIMADVKSANQKTQNHKFNRLVQGLLYDMIERSSAASATSATVDYSGTGIKKSGNTSNSSGKEAMWAVKLASDLWRKGTWRDARTANLISAACFHSNTKVQSIAIHFFLNTAANNDDSDSDDDSGDDNPNKAMNEIRKVKHQQTINKKRKSTEKAAKKEIRKANAKRKAAEDEAADKESGQVDNSALNLLHDPQTFAEKLYDLLVKGDKKFTLDHKVIIMQLFGRLTGLHKLYVLPFYSYINKYLAYSQLRITSILVALASSVHELVPPDVLTPVIRKLAHEFVHPGVSTQVIAAGLNSIREICKRQHWAMEPDLLEDLVEYRKSKDKGVLTASRALLQLYRDVNPDMLRKRERGKVATMNAIAGIDTKGPAAFGRDKDAQTTIEGLDLLEDYLAEKTANALEAGGEGAEGLEQEKDDEGDGWEVDSESSDDTDEEGWIAVSSDEEDGAHFDDSEDEDERAERRARKRVKTTDTIGSEPDLERAMGLERLEVTEEERKAIDDEKKDENVEGAEKAEALLLATTRILTPADFAKLNELRTAAAEAEIKAGGGGAAKRKLLLLQAAKKAMKRSADSKHGNNDATLLTEGDLIGVGKKAKADYEERMASIAKGREGREKFGSAKGKKKKENVSSSTNKEKRKKTKAFSMVMNSREVRKKGKGSLREKQKRLQGYSKSGKRNAKAAARL